METLQEGDVLATNDPWIGTGHLPDYVMISPVFRENQVVAFIGSIAHVSDVGGHAGDIEAMDVFQEGVRLPPCKLYALGTERGRVRNHRGELPRSRSCTRGSARDDRNPPSRRSTAGEFLDDYGLPDFRLLAREIHGRSETKMREQISALADGLYEFGLEIDGYEEIVRLHATSV